MTSVGVMASAVTLPSGVDVLLEPFNSFAAWGQGAGGTKTIVAGRTGTCASLAGTSISGHITYSIPTINQDATVTIGYAYRTPAIQASRNLMTRLMSDTATVTHVNLFLETNGAVRVESSGGTNIALSAAGVITVDTWRYVELQVLLGDAPNGAATIRVDGVQVATASGVDTRNAGTKTVFDSVRLAVPNPSTSGTNLYDDLYITVGAGAPFKGDITIP